MLKAGVALLAAAGMHGHAQTITVVNGANVRPAVVAKVEAATLAEVNGPLHRSWHTPKIKFGRGGWKLRLVPQLYHLAWDKGGCAPDGGAQGCHAYLTDGSQTPFMTVATFGDSWSDGIPPQWTSAFAHEIIETLTDRAPHNEVGEVCDETGDSAYQVESGVILPDFEMPNGHLAPEVN